jgi:hypothetical protein
VASLKASGVREGQDPVEAGTEQQFGVSLPPEKARNHETPYLAALLSPSLRGWSSSNMLKNSTNLSPGGADGVFDGTNQQRIFVKTRKGRRLSSYEST